MFIHNRNRQQADQRPDENDPNGQPIIDHHDAAAPLFVTVWQQLVCIMQSGFKVPTAPGIVYDLLSFMMGFVCSIVPQWTHINL